jgi:hypothetical protein
MLLQGETLRDTYDVPLEDQISLLNSSPSVQGDTPVSKYSKEELISVHLNNLALLKESSKSSEPKPLVLPAAYAPSISSLNDLQKVAEFLEIGKHKLTGCRYPSRI